MMLLQGSADYIGASKGQCMIDIPVFSTVDEDFPSKCVHNTHYRLDVLPKEFRSQKTVLGLLHCARPVIAPFSMGEWSLRKSCVWFVLKMSRRTYTLLNKQ